MSHLTQSLDLSSLLSGGTLDMTKSYLVAQKSYAVQGSETHADERGHQDNEEKPELKNP